MVCNPKGEYNIEMMTAAFQNINHITNFPKHRSVQYRISNTTLNKQLKLWKITNTDLCIICNLATADISHFFFE